MANLGGNRRAQQKMMRQFGKSDLKIQYKILIQSFLECNIMQTFEIKRGHGKKLEGGGLKKMMEEEFDSVKNEDDELIKDNQLQLLVNKKSYLYLVGTTLEFSDGLNGKGFVFNNPNASRTCGCGESFSL